MRASKQRQAAAERTRHGQTWASHNRMMPSYLKQWTSYSLASQPLFTRTFAATCRKSKRPCGTQHEEQEEQSCVVPHRQQRTSRKASDGHQASASRNHAPVAHGAFPKASLKPSAQGDTKRCVSSSYTTLQRRTICRKSGMLGRAWCAWCSSKVSLKPLQPVHRPFTVTSRNRFQPSFSHTAPCTY